MNTRDLQTRCDNSRTVDLGGKLWVVHKLAFDMFHTGQTIRNGTIFSPSDSGRPDKRYGIIELSGGLSATFENVHFVGPLTDYTDDFRINQARARQQGAFCAGVQTIAGRPESLTFRRCKFSNLFAGIGAFAARNVKALGCQFERIAGHGLVTSLPADNDRPMTLTMRQCSSRDCGSLFDISAPDATMGVAAGSAKASLLGCRAVNTLGRNKIAGMWQVTLDGCDFVQNRPIPNQFTGLSIPQAVSVEILDCEISGFIAGSIWSNDWQVRPKIDIRQSRLFDGQLAINSTAETEIRDSFIERCYAPWGSSVPLSSNVTVGNPVSTDKMAEQFLANRALVAGWNRLHGTQYDLDRYWWIDRPVRERMQQMEAS